jgi:eukaryotic-like serine/threonine-protein kinase
MATGKQAFVRNSAVETMAAIVRDDPPPIEQKLPAPLQWVIDRCLHKDAQQRYDSTLDLYRDLRTIRDHLSEAYSSATSTAVDPSGKKARRPWRWVAIVVALALLGAALLLDRWFGRGPVPHEVVSFAIYPPPKTVFSTPLFITLTVPQFALSPDGRTIVFAAGAEGERPLLWLRPIQEVAAQPMPGTEDGEDPFWSPDSRWIAFFAEGKLKKVPASGGAVQVVLPAVRERRGATWGSDDTILFATSGEQPIQRMAAAGGQPIALTTLTPDESTHRYPDFLPDGRHFLYLSKGENVQPSLYAGCLDDKSKKLIARIKNSAVYAAPGYLLFVDGDTLFGQRFDAVRLDALGQPFLIAEHAGATTTLKSAISTSATGVIAYSGALAPNGRLTWFDRAGLALNSTGPEGYYSDFRLSPNGKLLAASLLDRKTGSIEIWINDFARGSSSRVVSGDAALNATPIWSPDSAQLIYRIFRGTVQLYQRSAAGGGSSQLVLSYQTERAAGIQSFSFMDTDWSPDGKSMLCSTQNPNSGSDLWLLPLTGDKKPVQLLASPADEMHGNFSPDGRLIAYTSNESGKFQIYAQTLPFSDKKWQVSTTGGYEPRWRPDGHEIYYLSEDRKLMAVPVGPGPSFGVPKALFQTRVPAGVTANRMHYAPSRDGQRFLVDTESENQLPSSITVVMGWAARKF